MDRKPKTVFQLDSPYAAVQWPLVTSHDQVSILELLCNTLSPIGQYRTHHIPKSEGKRSRKRKRKQSNGSGQPPTPAPALPVPEISPFVMIGLKNVMRTLEDLSKRSKPHVQSDREIMQVSEESPSDETNKSPPGRHFAAVFVQHSSQPSVLDKHLPPLIATASLAYPELPPTRLVKLPKGGDTRLCAALALPRVSLIGILEEAPHCEALLDVVREIVPEIEIPWLEEVKRAAYMPVKINVIETSAPIAKKEKK